MTWLLFKIKIIVISLHEFNGNHEKLKANRASEIEEQKKERLRMRREK